MIRYLAAILLLFATPCMADVRLPRILGSKMVLQRNSDVKIWGWADPGEDVRVTCDWLDTPATTKAGADGKWQVQLKTGKAGGPHAITVSGKNRITLDDILFGEVWIDSGQSNMEMPLDNVWRGYYGVKNSAKEIAEAKYPEIRLFQVDNVSSKKPLEDLPAGVAMYGIPPGERRWRECSPETVRPFSAVAYFFARELHKQLKVPVGIIDASWGGTPAEAWTPAEGLKALGYKKELKQAEAAPQNSAGKFPTRLYNGMIHPLRKFKIKGVIWYQGEGNGGRADKYRELFSTMIGQWRKVFGHEFPFYYVQIAPFKYNAKINTAHLREAQLEAMSTPKTGMAVTMDVGNYDNIHPNNKQDVGRRLALWALDKDYGRKCVHSGPLYKSCKFDGDKARLEFAHTGSGLATRDGKAPSHFEMAGPDKVFHPATAVIEGNEVVVTSDKVKEPKAVRYAFSNGAMPNLMNREGLPASSFRTDRW